MLPRQHRQEALQRAYVSAVAAFAGVKAAFSTGTEYGVDGEFRTVVEGISATGQTLLFEDGYPVDFQMKATVGCRHLEEASEVRFDCDVSAYNKLVLQNRSGVVPVLLLVMCLPVEEGEWLKVTENVLELRRACYWHFVRGSQTTRGRSQVIRIPRSQLFTPKTLRDIMTDVAARGGI